jgi:hypothetical protein
LLSHFIHLPVFSVLFIGLWLNLLRSACLLGLLINKLNQPN